jgi:hypothetical protein
MLAVAVVVLALKAELRVQAVLAAVEMLEQIHQQRLQELAALLTLAEAEAEADILLLLMPTVAVVEAALAL